MDQFPQFSHRPESILGALTRDLLADLERVRPGLDAGSEDDMAAQLTPRLQVRLAELYRESYAAADEPAPSPTGAAASEGGPAPPTQLDLYRREVEQILLPRYAALALRQNRIDRAPVQLGGSADVFNRTFWGLLFGALGAFVVWAPFIPIWEKWIPFAAAALAVVFSSALPDVHRRLLRRRHEVSLLALLLDMDAAGRALPSPEDAAPRALPAHAEPVSAGAAHPHAGLSAREKA